jgi:hypothetical protein
MQYNQPLDKPSNPNAPYIDGNIDAGIQGSIVPAAGIENDQREVVEVITRANARGYVDFSGTPCAAPGNFDLTQLRKAIEGFITGWNFIIDTTITFKVHGTGYDFIDLNAAMSYLRKYYITTNGHVILQCGGATPGSSAAASYTYNQAVYFSHANNNRISVYGAPMLAAMPPNSTFYACNGYGSIAADTTNNLALVRQKFATEFHMQGGAGVVIYNGPNLMHFDGILLTGDGSAAAGLTCQASHGFMNTDSGRGIAITGFGSNGFFCALGATVGFIGPSTNSENSLCNIVSFGNGGAGCAVGDGSYLTMYGNLNCLSNGNHGLLMFPRTGAQLDGAADCRCNNGNGINMLLSPTLFVWGPLSGGTYYRPSYIWQNQGYGAYGQASQAVILGDFTNGNASGSIYAVSGANMHGQAGDLGISGRCVPTYGVVGNLNAWVG